MTKELFLCLANSQKHGGRCIAGFTNNGFKRPIASRSDGTLSVDHYKLNDGSEPQLLDCLEIDLSQASPQPHQPENWIISNRPWNLVSRLGDGTTSRQQYIKDLNILSLKTGNIFGDSQSKIEYKKIYHKPLKSSLAIVKPDSLKFDIVTYPEKKKIRTVFELNQQKYNLPITDPQAKMILDQLDEGYYSLDELDTEYFNPDNIFLTISLSQPFNDGYCYKLVAAIISF